MLSRKTLRALGVAIVLGGISAAALAQTNSDSDRRRGTRNPLLEQADRDARPPGVSPARRINRRNLQVPNAAPLNDTFRSIDSSGNNQTFTTMGSAHVPLLRMMTPDYGDEVQSLAGQGNPIPAGNLPLRDAFFSPHRVVEEGGIEPLLRGLASQVCQQVDNYVIDDVRNFLFGPPGAGGSDLASLNIQRGRDHGLPSYNEVRVALGLDPAESFADISSDPEVQEKLAAVYASVDDIDVWVGGLAEDTQPGALVGELITTVLTEQFEALRDGDKYWYDLTLSGPELQQVRNTRLADIIRRNTSIDGEIAGDVFHVRAASPQRRR